MNLSPTAQAEADRLEARLRELLFVHNVEASETAALLADIKAFVDTLVPRQVPEEVNVESARLLLPFILAALPPSEFTILLRSADEIDSLRAVSQPGAGARGFADAVVLAMAARTMRMFTLKLNIRCLLARRAEWQSSQAQDLAFSPENAPSIMWADIVKSWDSLSEAAYYTALDRFAASLDIVPRYRLAVSPFSESYVGRSKSTPGIYTLWYSRRPGLHHGRLASRAPLSTYAPPAPLGPAAPAPLGPAAPGLPNVFAASAAPAQPAPAEIGAEIPDPDDSGDASAPPPIPGDFFGSRAHSDMGEQRVTSPLERLARVATGKAPVPESYSTRSRERDRDGSASQSKLPPLDDVIWGAAIRAPLGPAAPGARGPGSVAAGDPSGAGGAHGLVHTGRSERMQVEGYNVLPGAETGPQFSTDVGVYYVYTRPLGREQAMLNVDCLTGKITVFDPEPVRPAGQPAPPPPAANPARDRTPAQQIGPAEVVAAALALETPHALLSQSLLNSRTSSPPSSNVSTPVHISPSPSAIPATPARPAPRAPLGPAAPGARGPGSVAAGDPSGAGGARGFRGVANMGPPVANGGYGEVFRAANRPEGTVCYKRYKSSVLWWQSSAIIEEIYNWQYLAARGGAPAHIVLPRALYTESAFNSQLHLFTGSGFLYVEMQQYWGSLSHYAYTFHAEIAAMPAPARHRLWRGVGLKLAQALAWIHAQGLTHGDLKPQNVLCSPSQQGRHMDYAEMHVFVSDFGISRVHDADSLTAYSRATGSARVGLAKGTTVVAQTCGYRAPEAFFSSPMDGAIAPFTDVFAYAMSMLEMCHDHYADARTFGELVAAVGYPRWDTLLQIVRNLYDGVDKYTVPETPLSPHVIIYNLGQTIKKLEALHAAAMLQVEIAISPRENEQPKLRRLQTRYPSSLLLAAANTDYRERPAMSQIAAGLAATAEDADPFAARVTLLESPPRGDARPTGVNAGVSAYEYRARPDYTAANVYQVREVVRQVEAYRERYKNNH